MNKYSFDVQIGPNKAILFESPCWIPNEADMSQKGFIFVTSGDVKIYSETGNLVTEFDYESVIFHGLNKESSSIYIQTVQNKLNVVFDKIFQAEDCFSAVKEGLDMAPEEDNPVGVEIPEDPRFEDAD